jgi:hypothetical protein
MSARQDCVRDMEGECVADPDAIDRLVGSVKSSVDESPCQKSVEVKCL